MQGFATASISSLLVRAGAANEINLALEPERKAPSQAPSNAAPKFYDEPQFTVSGVTDTTSLGGHGSDTVVRTRDSLAKETVSLGTGSATTPALETGSQPSHEAIEAERDRAQALLAKDPSSAEPHHMLADAEEKLGDSLAAVREYERAAELEPREAYLFDWGSELLLHHAPEPALEVFAKGNRLFPRSERMLLGMGAAYFARGSIEKAIEKLRAASELNPSDPTPYLFAAKMEGTEKTPSPAVVDMLQRFVTLQPESAEANYNYAAVLWRSREGAQDGALAAQVESLLRKAIRFDQKLTGAYLQLGIVHTQQREFQKAIADYRQAIATDPHEADSPNPQIEEAHFRLAGAYRQIGESEKAARELQVYEQMAKASQQETARERHEIQQFVYTLRDQPSVPVQ